MKNLIKNISKNLNSKFFFEHDTSKNVWFQAGGLASVFCLVHNEKELQFILGHIENIPYEIIGAGSNILIRDGGFDGIIFKLGKNFNKITINKSYIEVGAGILDKYLSKFLASKNITNFEFYSGIPGTIGGAVKMNAGCYGSETKDILRSVRTINNDAKFYDLTNKQINLTYRSSKIPKNNIIISAKFDYTHGNSEDIDKKMNYIKESRENTQPLQKKTSGSTFKNPKNNFAAKLIELSGCKGMSVGDVYVSEKHANFLINTNQASASQIEELGKKVIDQVYNQFKIRLEWEVKIIGK